MIHALIIEDETKAADMLQIMLQKNHDDIVVVDKCNDLPAGVRSIRKHKPNLIFLDIEMPGYSGLQLLEFFNEDEVDFSIIFTTAFNDYAIKAFELSAIDYILKPIQIDKLNAAIERYKKQQQKEIAAVQKLALLKHNLSGKQKRIAVPVSSGVEIIKLDDIIYLQADGSYTKIFLLHNKQLLVSKNLRFFEDLIADDTQFFRNHRSYLVNIQHIKKVLRSDGGIIQLETLEEIPIVTDKIDELIKVIHTQ